MNISHPSTRGGLSSFGANTNEQKLPKLTEKGPKMATTKNSAGNEYEWLLDDVISDRSALYRSAHASHFQPLGGQKMVKYGKFGVDHLGTEQRWRMGFIGQHNFTRFPCSLALPDVVL